MNRDDFEVIKRECCYDGYFKVDRYTVRHRLYDGGWRTVVREIFERGEAVGVLPFDPVEDTVCLIRQFRAGMIHSSSTPWPYEIIAGMMDIEGETIEQVGLRELQEEAGIIDCVLEPIVSYWVSPGGTTERIHLFCGISSLQKVQGIHGHQHEGEDILVEVLSRQDAMALMQKGLIDNAATLIALLWLEQHAERLKRQFHR